jgi:hypothetical protein
VTPYKVFVVPEVFELQELPSEEVNIVPPVPTVRNILFW